MSADSPVLEVLTAAAAVFAELGAPWYLFGAQAVTVWGRPRVSADVDVTAELSAPQDRFVAAMLAAGFDLRVAQWKDLLALARVIPFVHRASQVPLDVIVAGRGLELEFLERAVKVSFSGLVIPVISPEDLVVTKVLASRTKDIDDVRGILRERREKLDLGRIRRVLEMLEQALSRSDLLGPFEDLLRRA